MAAADGRATVARRDIEQAATDRLPFRRRANDDWEIAVGNGDPPLVISATDKRQYSSVAYALRAVLAVQQEMLLAATDRLPPLEPDAVDALKDLTDIYTLGALQLADRRARLDNESVLTAMRLEESWARFAAPSATPEVAERRRLPASAGASTDFRVIREIIAQKVDSYATYNDVANTIFVRNLQVYFARLPWPADAAQGVAFRDTFVQALVNFGVDLYLGAESVATQNGHALIREDDVHEYAHRFVPHEINEYEDALFFPRLPPDQRVAIESYDMDAFRDSGTHWLYLQRALEAPDFTGTLEPDPFAAELLAENIAQFGVLVLRMVGTEAREAGADRLHPDHINLGLGALQDRITAHARVDPANAPDATIRSSTDALPGLATDRFFTDVTAEVGIDVDHRSADWLNRLLRTYLPAGDNVGNLTIPPAFGGAGIAADDLNGDDYPDLLILSGRGNRLFLNDTEGGFTDVTATSGIDWRRPDSGLPGEPRQPIIADLDNDGLRDILITYVDDAHRLFRNVGNGRFADVTDRAKLGGAGMVGGPATVFDFDRDGLLDIYITYFGNYVNGVLPTLKRRNDNGSPNALFRNTGTLTFADVTAGSGLDNTGWTQAVAHTDLDGDGWQDVIVGNDFGVNAYYRNRRDGTFENIAERIGTDKPSYTMNIGITDLNDDDDPDIYISNIVTMNKDETYVLPNADTVARFDPVKMANMRVVEANDLFLSQRGPDGLAYVSSDLVGRGYSSTGWAWDADFFDFENDGDDDLYVLNGMNEFAVYSSEHPYYTDPHDNQRLNVHIPVATRESNVFFVNDGGRLQNASPESGVDLLGNSRSAAYLDFDRDGDLDIIVGNYHGPSVFYRNNAERLGGNWLSVQLVGDPSRGSSRDAIGARLVVTTANGGRVWREVHGTIGYMSVHPKEQHVGLGTQTTATIRVQWPGGDVSTFTDVHANRRYRVDQSLDPDTLALLP